MCMSCTPTVSFTPSAPLSCELSWPMAPAMATCGVARPAAALQFIRPQASPPAHHFQTPLPSQLQLQCGASPRALAVSLSTSFARAACGATLQGASAPSQHQRHQGRVQGRFLFDSPGAPPRRQLVVASSGTESGVRTDCKISLGTAVIPADVDLQALESVLYQWANNITQSSNLPLPFAAKVDKIPGGFRLSSMVRAGPQNALQSEVDIVVTVAPGAGGEPPMFRAVREGQEGAPAWEPGLIKALLTTLIEGVKMSRKA